MSATISKLVNGGLDWMNGYTLQYYLIRDGLRWGIDLGVWLGQQHDAVLLLSWVTILFEGSFFLVLVFPMLAWIYIPVGVAFHIGIYLTQRADFFTFIALYVVFIQWVPLCKALAHRLRFLEPRKKPEIFFDGQCPLCIRSMTVIRYFDWFNRLSFADLETQWPRLKECYPGLSLEDCRREIHVLISDESVHKGFFAFREILWYLPPLWPLLVAFYFPLASTVGPKLYSLVASKRLRFQRCSFDTCSIRSNRK